MESKISWLIWIPLILLLVFSFPKTCGTAIPSEFMEYTCAGFKAPFLTSLQSSNNSQEWCSGICFSKTKKMIEPNKTQENTESPNPLIGVTESFGKVVPVILLILIVIGALRWIGSAKKSSQRGEIKVYRNP